MISSSAKDVYPPCDEALRRIVPNHWPAMLLTHPGWAPNSDYPKAICFITDATIRALGLSETQMWVTQ